MAICFDLRMGWEGWLGWMVERGPEEEAAMRISKLVAGEEVVIVSGDEEVVDEDDEDEDEEVVVVVEEEEESWMSWEARWRGVRSGWKESSLMEHDRLSPASSRLVAVVVCGFRPASGVGWPALWGMNPFRWWVGDWGRGGLEAFPERGGVLMSGFRVWNGLASSEGGGCGSGWLSR